jgi:hypothetical protein
MAEHTVAGGGRARGARLGIAIPRPVGPAGPSLERTLGTCVAMGIAIVELSFDAIDTVLGAPVPTVPLEPPSTDGVTLGLLELEEDVLRDSYELAKQTFDAQLRAWRTSASLTPLGRFRLAWQSAGVSIDVVSIPDLALWTDDEVDHACRAARAAGARVVATRASFAGAPRLAVPARRHDLLLSFIGDSTTGAAELDRLLARDDRVAVGIDVGAWTSGGHGSPVPFIIEHARRISHVRLGATGDAHMREVLRAMRDHNWAFPAMVVVDPAPGGYWDAEVARVLADCRVSLR